MRIELKFQKSPETKLASRAYDPGNEDIRSILMDVCRVIEHQGDFVVSGFGQDRWPVDIGTDLLVFLEQLPDALCAINSGEATEIDFYEQGVERLIEFLPIDDHYEARCASRTSWQPNPMTEKIDKAILENMLLAVKNEFMRVFTEVAPSLVKHQWVRHWLQQ